MPSIERHFTVVVHTTSIVDYRCCFIIIISRVMLLYNYTAASRPSYSCALVAVQLEQEVIVGVEVQPCNRATLTKPHIRMQQGTGTAVARLL